MFSKVIRPIILEARKRKRPILVGIEAIGIGGNSRSLKKLDTVHVHSGIVTMVMHAYRMLHSDRI